MVEFDEGFRAKSDRLEKMWTVVSAVGLWSNEGDHIQPLIHNEDGETTCELFALAGSALLTVLAAIEAAGELKPNSRFLDLTLGIAYYLELSHDLPAYGIKGEYVTWRTEAVNYFKKGNLVPEKGTFAAKLRIEKLEKVEEFHRNSSKVEKPISKMVTNGTTKSKKTRARSSAQNPVMILEVEDADKENASPEVTREKNVSPPRTSKGKRKRDLGDVMDVKDAGKDPWHWAQKFAAYKKRQGNTLGGEKYDITKMSRADRAAAAFSGKDPLAKIPVKFLKENLLDRA